MLEVDAVHITADWLIGDTQDANLIIGNLLLSSAERSDYRAFHQLIEEKTLKRLYITHQLRTMDHGNDCYLLLGNLIDQTL